jgi:4-hydroxybenzoate polyprenyltransferase
MNDAARPSLLLSYARLLRIPNVFTALADIGMGLAFVGFPVEKYGLAAAALGIASALLYLSGMVLNDLFDLEIDRVERPERPLPSGQIPLAKAQWLGFTLLGGGVVAAWAAGLGLPNGAAMPWRSGVVGLSIAVCVLLYNRVLKHTFLGPLGMGLCRCGNVLLGMSLAGFAATGKEPGWLGYEPSQWMTAAGIGVYIVGVTWFARSEAATSARVPLAAALIVMAGGITLLGLMPNYAGTYGEVRFKPDIFWPVLLAALFVPLARGGGNAVLYPDARHVQRVVKAGIQSLILFDAAIAMGVYGPQWGLAVIALVVPMVVLGRWVYST